MKKVLVPLALLATASISHAVTLISNMPGNDATQTAGISTLRGKAMAFTTSAGLTYSIKSIDVRLNVLTPSTLNPIFNLKADNAGNPGGLLMTFANPTFTTSGINTYTFTGAFNLAANTKYWLEMFAAPGSSTFDWKASTPAQTPIGIFSHTGSLFTTNSGTTWSSSATLTSYALQGNAVPEPLSIAAIGLGFVALRKRRRA